MSRKSHVEYNPRFRRLINQLPKELTEVLKKEIEASGQLVFEAAQALVPVDTGRLRASLTLRINRRGTAVEIGYSRKFGKRKWNAAGWYAGFVEKGTIKQRAQPFLRPSLERNHEDIVQRHRMAIQQLLNVLDRR